MTTLDANPLRAAALRYGALLLLLIRRAGVFKRWDQVDDLCDRFERLMANLPPVLPVAHPLVWEGDYA